MLLRIILILLYLSSSTQAITLARVVSEGNALVRYQPRIENNNIKSILPRGSVAIVFEKSTILDTIDAITDYWYAIEVEGERNFEYPIGWVFGYSLDVFELNEFKDYDELVDLTMAQYPDARFTPLLSESLNECGDFRFQSVPDSMRFVTNISLDNIDSDSSYEIFVQYNCIVPLWEFCGVDKGEVLSKFYLLDKKTIGYETLEIGTENYERRRFIGAVNLTENYQKELVIERSYWVEGEGEDHWEIWYNTGKKYDLIASILIKHNLYEGRILFSNTDSDLESEIISKGIEKTYDYENGNLITGSSEIKEVYDWDGTRYHSVERKAKVIE